VEERDTEEEEPGPEEGTFAEEEEPGPEEGIVF
jgi:hypothetical protein